MRGLPVVPVDICARISVSLFLKDDADRGIYNITNDSAFSEEDIQEVFGEFGIDGEFVPFKEWREAVFDTVEDRARDLGVVSELYADSDNGQDPIFLSLHPLVTETEAVNFSTISKKLVKNLPSVTSMMIPAKEILRRHLHYHFNHVINNA